MAAILTVRGEDGNLIPIPAIQGTPGIGISNITRTAGTGAPGTTDIYTITLEDGRTSEFTVYNGRNGVDGSGSGSGDMLAYIYDPTGKAQDIFEYADGKAGDVSTQLEAHKSSATAHSDIREVANAAKSSADAAQTAAYTASATAQTAQTIANAAQAAAAGAMGFKRVLTSADDMDTLYEEGIYRADSNSLPANFPLTVSGIVEVINTATENKDAPTYGVEQRVTRYGASGTTFSRTKSGNAWHEWAKDFNSQNKPTAADVGAMPVNGMGAGYAPAIHLGGADAIPYIYIGEDKDIWIRYVDKDTGETNWTSITNLVKHTQAASTITAGGFAGKVTANGTAMASLGDTQLRNIYAGTSDMTAGTTALGTGAIYLVYE